MQRMPLKACLTVFTPCFALLNPFRAGPLLVWLIFNTLFDRYSFFLCPKKKMSGQRWYHVITKAPKWSHCPDSPGVKYSFPGRRVASLEITRLHGDGQVSHYCLQPCGIVFFPDGFPSHPSLQRSGWENRVHSPVGSRSGG